MDIKKIFINCMLVLCVAVVIFSVVTVVKRGSEPQNDTEITYDMMENSEIVIGTEYDENTEEIGSSEVADSTENTDVEVPADAKVLYTTSKVNVRTGPATTYSSLGEVPVGTEVSGVGELDDAGWQKIIYNGQEAYILGRYLTDEVPDEEDDDQTASNSSSSNSSQSSNRGQSSNNSSNTSSSSSNNGAWGYYQDPYHGQSAPQNNNTVTTPTTPTNPTTPETPVDTPTDTPVDTPTDVPVDTPVDTPVEPPAVPETPAEPAA